MGKMIDLNGMVFGELTVIERYDNNHWLCGCSCGNQKVILTNDLTSGRNTSCGHSMNLKDQRFERLLVVSDAISSNGKIYWDCLCNCGNIKRIRGDLLRSGKVKSCGCFRRENQSNQIVDRLRKLSNKRFYFFDGRKRIYCDSSYEVFLWNYYRYTLNEEIIYSPNSLETPYGKYLPDFYIPSFGIYIETKGSFAIGQSYKQEEKIEYLKNQGVEIVVLFWDDIVDACELQYKADTTYFRIAKKMNLKVEDYLARRLYMEG